MTTQVTFKRGRRLTPGYGLSYDSHCGRFRIYCSDQVDGRKTPWRDADGSIVLPIRFILFAKRDSARDAWSLCSRHRSRQAAQQAAQQLANRLAKLSKSRSKKVS